MINKMCLPENYPSSFFLDMHYNNPELFLVAVSEDKAAGYIMCRLEHGFSEAKRLKLVRKGHVVSLAVLPDFRRAGIAGSLVKTALERMATKADECFLEVRSSNQSAVTLYQSLGFRETRRISHYYMDGEEATLMYKAVNE
ncbi:MAG: N-acetyltransferase [archaeon]